MNALLRLLLAAALLIAVGAARAADGRAIAFAWADADLAFTHPAAWGAPSAESDGDRHTLTWRDAASDADLRLIVLEDASLDESALQTLLESDLLTLALYPLSYRYETRFGARGLTIDRRYAGVAWTAILPDDRPLLAYGRAPAGAEARIVEAMTLIATTLTLSAAIPPPTPVYTETARAGGLNDALIGALAASAERVYAVDVDRGVRVYALDDLQALPIIPFDAPVQPTGAVVSAAGDLVIGDLICRCLRRLAPDGTWLEPLTGLTTAPYSVAATADGAVYATDRISDAYVLHRFAPDGVRQTTLLSFNGSAPPRVIASQRSASVWVLEWLRDLFDERTDAGVADVMGDDARPDLRFWLAGMTYDRLVDLITISDEMAALATRGEPLLRFYATEPQVDPPLMTPERADEAIDLGGAPRAVTIAEDGSLVALITGRGLVIWRSQLATDRTGSPDLRLDVPVQGQLRADSLPQTWTYRVDAPQRATINAVDPGRTEAFSIGLDMAIRVIAPDGAVIADNDDQISGDLFGVYDAQIADLAFEQIGVYRIEVRWRQGAGTYTLGVTSTGAIRALEPSGVTRITDRLSLVLPVARIGFYADAGETYSITLMPLDGGLDPTLLLYDPAGALIAFNDDAANPELGRAAQLVSVTLPVSGFYAIDSATVSGSGRYELVVLRLSPSD